MMQSVDVAIIGGGMVGLTVAAALESSGLRIAVIESQLPDTDLTDLPDVRVSAISRASEYILDNVGAWQGITSRRAAPYRSMTVWEQDSFARIDFEAEQIAQRNLGHIVENRVIQLSLLDMVSKQENVTLLAPERCSSIMFGESEAWLTLESGKAITAKLVVGADGANSWLRNQVNIPLTHWDYGHSALVANIRTVENHTETARQIFRPEGPLAFLPLGESNLSSIVWSLDPLNAENLVSMPEDEFNKQLTAAFDNQLGLCRVEGERQVFSLKMRYAKDFVKDRVVLVGDAAHTIHPLAGQGVNLGLADAAALAETIIELHQEGKDIGLKTNLRPFERWRKAEAAQMIASMQSFKVLFSGSNPIKKLVRGIGMSLTNEVTPVKDECLKRALGLSGRQPKMAQHKA
ncbi:FAD-dependent 2-octaprenylphenol hydroxylase [Aliivibrio sp. S4TY2]|uniref:FAD-dependent 2-octaprenylphenol hydroxylase n=1 Tax=unclassified Aliivibrio TaxID=2645654 RepID=UPI0023781648|nr:MULTISPECIES: FAD-dependent 2-octaprenylphenol hydroxylase [unclassified Aliivibrio]MDD9155038.1 FAD-dependent 2-octaprenylphenol hydroxylase [Aliivibrio sp. S4TY2]MDD9158599.1 FAD-dependent 2-octaprenylphenol hydroxylase [Aliivibrio sp. S4TY1]MDD9163041.1 FAD-dependent 2-octaprenylphenol hydroxylase [Aliivibrio sp. S4MY2]MDD9166598.1 FAD-dependent 2-octaprenylphenol hydroxylase [Aliivibrio sp. S4MY4]MDD9184118.1 FAD-dependent 2-octaprenylphenol hydroxylase [Aliivibrio sp. S4MY3]